MENQLTLWNWGATAPSDHPPAPQTFMLPDADIQLYESVWSAPESDRGLAQLLHEIPWRQETAHLFQQAILIPRLTAWYGDAGKSYTYSGIDLHPEPWTPTLLGIKSTVEAIAGVTFNSVLINLYRHGQDSVGWHRDAEPSLGRNPVIASVSLGATRRFSLKHLHRRDLKPVHLDLTHGSLLLMQGTTQHYWLHQVPKTAKAVGQRINLTFRSII